MIKQRKKRRLNNPTTVDLPDSRYFQEFRRIQYDNLPVRIMPIRMIDDVTQSILDSRMRYLPDRRMKRSRNGH